MKDWDAGRVPESPFVTPEYREYEAAQLKIPCAGDRWTPPDGVKLAGDLYGREAGKTAFVVGCGPSIEKARKHLVEPVEGAFTIGINRAVESVRCDYWFFIDAVSYFASKDKRGEATPCGVDRFHPLYGPEVHVWRRAYEPEDILAGRLVHRSTSLIAALHFAVWLGAERVVTVGCDNALPEDYAGSEESRLTNEFTYKRINVSLMRDLGYWLPSWVSLADASVPEGGLLLPKTHMGEELRRLRGGTISTADTV